MTAFALAACGQPASEDTAPVATAGPAVPASVRYDQYGAAGEQLPPADDLVNPVGDDPQAVQQGKLLFSAMNCDGCHGGGGLGFVGPSLVDGAGVMAAMTARCFIRSFTAVRTACRLTAA